MILYKKWNKVFGFFGSCKNTLVCSALLLSVLFCLKEIIFGDFYDPEVYNPFYMTKKDPNYGKVSTLPIIIYLFLEALGLGKTWLF